MRFLGLRLFCESGPAGATLAIGTLLPPRAEEGLETARGVKGWARTNAVPDELMLDDPAKVSAFTPSNGEEDLQDDTGTSALELDSKSDGTITASTPDNGGGRTCKITQAPQH